MSGSGRSGASDNRRLPRWRWVALLQLWLLLISAGLFASFGMVAPMIVTMVAFALGMGTTALIVNREDHRDY